jgi:hypothetical protein
MDVFGTLGYVTDPASLHESLTELHEAGQCPTLKPWTC